MTSIRLKIEESWYASMDCKVQKSGPWVCFYGGHSTGYKLGNHPKNIEPCAHRATTPPWGTSLGEDKVGAGARILNIKVARAGQTFPLNLLLGAVPTLCRNPL